MDLSNLPNKLPAVTGVYTDLNGLQQLKAEGDKDLALKKVAKQFESLFVSMLMKNMRAANAVFEEDSIFNSKDTQFFRDMHDQQLSLTMAEGKGIGIADVLYRQMSRAQGNADEHGANSIDRDISAYLNRAAAAGYKLKPNPMALQHGTDAKQLNSHQLKNNSNASDSSAGNKEIPSTGEPVTSTRNHSERVAIAGSPDEFIQKLLPFAKKAAQALGVDKYILIAQSALETGWGKFVLAGSDGVSSNNLFNIKSFSQAQDSIQHTTLEYENGIIKKENADFRTYKDLAESFNDFVSFIQGNERYSLASQAQGDSETFIDELHKAGYATDPEYKKKVLNVYEQVKSFVDAMPNFGFDATSVAMPSKSNVNNASQQQPDEISAPFVEPFSSSSLNSVPGLGIKNLMSSGKSGNNL